MLKSLKREGDWAGKSNNTKDSEDGDDDNRGGGAKGLLDAEERLHFVYFTYSFKRVQELLKRGDLVADRRSALEAQKQAIPGISSTTKPRPPATAPYLSEKQFNNKMEKATTPVRMVSRSSADAGQQAAKAPSVSATSDVVFGEKRPAAGLGDFGGKPAKKQKSLGDCWGQSDEKTGKEAMD